LCFHGPSSIFKGREPFFTTSYVELGVAFGGKEDEKRRKPDVLNSDQKAARFTASSLRMNTEPECDESARLASTPARAGHSWEFV
jgi:hypothetical protein